jgi:hypothetical protein
MVGSKCAPPRRDTHLDDLDDSALAAVFQAVPPTQRRLLALVCRCEQGEGQLTASGSPLASWAHSLSASHLLSIPSILLGLASKGLVPAAANRSSCDLIPSQAVARCVRQCAQHLGGCRAELQRRVGGGQPLHVPLVGAAPRHGQAPHAGH